MRLRKINTNKIARLRSEIAVAKHYIITNLLSSAQLRVTFFMQVLGMMVNNTAFLISWLFFTQTFGIINGWGATEVIGLQGVVAFVYGICFTFFGGVDDLSVAIHNGSFDTLLTTPRSIYLRILTLQTKTSAVGDLVYGSILLLVFLWQTNFTVPNIIALALVIIPAVIIFTNFTVIAACVSFFLPDSYDIYRNIFEMLLGPAMYPGGGFQNTSRIIFTFLIPSLAIGTIPVETIAHQSLSNILLLWTLAFGWFLLARWVLAQGLKRYESGNMTGSRI